MITLITVITCDYIDYNDFKFSENGNKTLDNRPGARHIGSENRIREFAVGCA